MSDSTEAALIREIDRLRAEVAAYRDTAEEIANRRTVILRAENADVRRVYAEMADMRIEARQAHTENERLRAENERLREWQRQMVEKAADKSLVGYRELADTCARLSSERDTLRAALLDRDASVLAFGESIVRLNEELDTLRELVWQALEDERAGISDHGPDWKRRADKALSC